MAPKPGLLPRSPPIRLPLSPRARPQTRPTAAPSICPFCSLAAVRARPLKAARRAVLLPRRWQSAASDGPRAELERTLLELQSRHPNLVNLSRLQLALQGLRQPPGHEVVRIAILGLADGQMAKTVLKSLLSDPLKDEEAWERELNEHDASKPLVVRVAPSQRRNVDLHISTDAALHELHVSSPSLNTLNLEFLLMQVTAPYGAIGDVSLHTLEDAVLVPTVDVPSADHRVSPVTTPVHRALLIADGLMGAVNVSALPISEAGDLVKAAVQLQGVSRGQLEATFDVIDASMAEQGVRLFRQGPQNAMEYEHLWSASNLPTLVTWLKAGATTAGDATKPAVRQLVASLLQNALASIQAQESRKLSRTFSAQSDSPALGDLNHRLAQWTQQAHAELQEELDLAFTGRRWRKLGWWKLFWRVDDVAMLTNEMLSRRFMPTAEQELVYLTGRIAQGGGHLPHYPQPASQRDVEASESRNPREHAPAFGGGAASTLPKWPGHIAFTRRYLQNETVPALQSLAQKLVVQSLGTSGLTTSLAALLYVSSWASSLYEAGAVAALGIVYSLGRMQKKWETARGYWEGEVREEGRKAVRGAEESVAAVLDVGGPSTTSGQETKELGEARELVAKAEDALARMR
ncbi:hypothetical protein HRG_000695 [Hirsutella rhossiliensis]|uniref:Serine threonine protein phosphatase 2b catalytic subunit protein n=1 Tax=Hirsutella rhossiliensis TaxID=111463 RepID=A0A9P8N5K8_9HYPO|nr:putative serine threonine protein phosphatase 2b catalytic subunit protein [Hirsutella rhossiliensis]KAH0968053.1 putative serine threonine protein phosphatase 2b catalytic subunit protein [Hirsutella rhossiliensis]